VGFARFGFMLYELSHFHSGARDDFDLLGCDAALLHFPNVSKKYVASIFKASK
jgi:hypothetical protein